MEPIDFANCRLALVTATGRMTLNPIVEAAAQAIETAHRTGVVYIPRPKGPPEIDYVRWGADVVAAVHPLIEAEVLDVIAALHDGVGVPAVDCEYGWTLPIKDCICLMSEVYRETSRRLAAGRRQATQ